MKKMKYLSHNFDDFKASSSRGGGGAKYDISNSTARAHLLLVQLTRRLKMNEPLVVALLASFLVMSEPLYVT